MKKIFFVLLAILAASSFSVRSARAQVTSQRLLDSAKEPQNWLMYSGDYSGHRFSALDRITAANASALVPKWAYQTMAGGKFETTPLVVDGVLYGTGQDDRAYALDARTGRPIWQYQRALPADIRPCRGASIAVSLFSATSFPWHARYACYRARFENWQCDLGCDCI